MLKLQQINLLLDSTAISEKRLESRLVAKFFIKLERGNVNKMKLAKAEDHKIVSIS